MWSLFKSEFGQENLKDMSELILDFGYLLKI